LTAPYGAHKPIGEGMPLDSLIWSRDVDGNWHELRVAPHPGARVAISDATMTRILTTDAALELVFQLLRAAEQAKGRAPGKERCG
jgi:hypothetical protein